MIGAAYSFGLLGLLSIGIFVLPCALLATVYLVRRTPEAELMTGILSGIGIPFLVLAFLNRSEATAMQPWPWLLSGVFFGLLGPATYVLSANRRRSR